MESTVSPEMTGDIVQNDKPKTTFVKDAPEMSRYTLSDSRDSKSRYMDYHIELLTKDDVPAVLKFLRRFFFRDEPLNQCIELIPKGEDSTCLELEEYSMSSIPDNLSVKAVSTNGEIIGVCLNGIMGPPTDGEPEYVTNCKNPKFKKITRLLYYVDKNANVARRYPGKKIMELRIISVNTNWRGRGVAKALLEKTLELGKQQGFDLLRADCTSAFSGKMCERFGMKPIYELKYDQYLDQEGNRIFSPESPHSEVRTYIRQL